MTNEPRRITLEDVQQKLAGFSFTKQTEEQADLPSASASPYFEAAAVLAFYHPAEIQPAGQVHPDEKNSLLNQLIGCSTIIADTTATGSFVRSDLPTVKKGTYKILFVLKDEIRKKTLIKLISEKRLDQAFAANPTQVLESKVPSQYLLTKCLKAETIDLNKLNASELIEFYKVIDWLDGIPGVSYASRERIIDKIELQELLSPFKRLTGGYEDGVFTNRFRGRQRELAILRSYVGVAPPKGVVETVERFVSTFVSSDKKPLLIFGMGGVGKSTLLAKFILEHLEAQQADRFPFVYLDFDRPNLSALEPETLLIEAARQLSIQYRDAPDTSAKFSSFYRRWNNSYGTLLEGGSSGLINLNSETAIKRKSQNKGALQTEFLALVKELTTRERKPFLIVLDTFEEVQYKGSEFVKAVLDFVENLQKKFPRMRIVQSGRSPVDKKRTIELELGDLDLEAATGYVMGLGIKEPATAKIIAEKIGGNPLSLKLATDLVKQYGADEIKALRTTNTINIFFSKRVPELELQGILYQRILEHIHDPEVKKLAHPGMVLRKITPELILQVLARPCNLKNIYTLADAEALFQEISRESALVTRTEALVLKHRSDLRKVMLKLIMQSDKKDQAMQIHKSAVAYYSQQSGMTNMAEEFYHRLALGESPRTLEQHWIDGLENYLVGSRDELPEKAQAFLMAKAGIESMDLSIWELADVEDQHRHLAKKAANLLNSGMADRALQLIAEIPVAGNHGLTLIEVRALRQLGRFTEAAEISRRAINSFYSDVMQPNIKIELQRYALGENMPGNVEPSASEEAISDEEDEGNEDGMTSLSV